MNTSKKNLVKNIHTDAKITLALGIGTAVGAGMYLLRWVTTILASSYADNFIMEYAKNFGKYGMTAAAIILLGNMLLTMCKEDGKPFDKVNAGKMKKIAMVMMLSAPVGIVLGIIAGFMDPTFGEEIVLFGQNAYINSSDLILMIVGAVIGILASVFEYGSDIEEDLEQIA